MIIVANMCYMNKIDLKWIYLIERKKQGQKLHSDHLISLISTVSN